MGVENVDALKALFKQLTGTTNPFTSLTFWGVLILLGLPEALALVCLDFAINSGAAWQIINRLRLKLERDPTPREVIRARGHYMVDLACGFVLADERKVRYWTEVLPGWMRRLRDNLRIVRTMEG